MAWTLPVTSAALNKGWFHMDMTGERRIPAPRQTVWEALNDTEVLKASIPGCESLEKLADDQMRATAAVKVGPISARFTGKVQLTDIDAPNGYRISGEGQGGVAGFAKGGANVALTDDGAGTLLSYQVNAQVGGKLAQLGGRLIDATAKQMADAFFDRFSKQVQAMSAVAEAAPGVPGFATDPASRAPAAEPPDSVSVWSMIPREPFGLPIVAWVSSGIFVVMVLLMLGSML
jgi:carbon monoxide dehydrogenase subunit G